MFLVVDHFSWRRSLALGKDSKDIVVGNNLVFFRLLVVLTVLQVRLASRRLLLLLLSTRLEGRQEGLTDVSCLAAIVVLPSKPGYVQLVRNFFG